MFFQDKVIEKEKLELLLNNKFNENFNDLKDEALLGNTKKTNKLIGDTVLQADKNLFYLNLINQRLKKILDVRKISKDVSLENAVNNIKPPIFWKEKTSIIDQAKKWDDIKIIKIINEANKVELELKSNSTINHNILIKKLIIDICIVANS